MSNKEIVIDANKISYNVGEIANEIASTITLPNAVVHASSKYTKLDKIQAVSVYIVVGKYRETARFVGVPVKTLWFWGQQDWWTDCIAQAQTINSRLINARTSKIINMSFDAVEQRLAQGDYATYDSDAQEIVYKPVSAKDSAIIFGVMFDKNRINNSLATTINQSTTTHLIDIQQQFNTMSKARVLEHDS